MSVIGTTDPRAAVIPTARVLCFLDRGHRAAAVCSCGLDVATSVGINSLVYSFEVCRCDQHDYDHLVEQLWHRDCFLDDAPSIAERGAG